MRAILHGILPVSDRARGLLNDGKLAGSPEPMALEAIRAPTLALSLEDDRFETLAAARHIAATVAGARLISLPDRRPRLGRAQRRGLGGGGRVPVAGALSTVHPAGNRKAKATRRRQAAVSGSSITPVRS